MKSLETNGAALECWNYKSHAQWLVDDYNSKADDFEDYDCPICKNKEFVAELEVGKNGIANCVYKICSCKAIRANLNRIKRSGLKDQIEKCTFQNFETKHSFQKQMKDMALKFISNISNTSNNWFYISGQVGCGKTHISTAMVGKLIKEGFECQYMCWRDEIGRLKRLSTEKEYNELIYKLKTVQVLYIDDFFKQAGMPTVSDINTAYEIINYRCNDKNLITLITTEKPIQFLLNIDYGMGSRIRVKSKDFSLHIGDDKLKNYRLRDLYQI